MRHYSSIYEDDSRKGLEYTKKNCRHYHCKFNDIQSLLREDLFVSRAKLSYEENWLKKNYVINKRRYLANLRDSDITQLAQDIMNTSLKGSEQYELLFLLLRDIQLKDFTLEEL